ncbi:MAG: MMPL family transporter [Thermoplasmataceae archaeon]
MFENGFGRLGDFVSRNSGKVIIAWVVLLVVLTPFASLLFSETSYNIGSDIVPSNSMANIADKLQSEYFSSSNQSSNSSSLVVVLTGVNVSTPSGFQSLYRSQNLVNSYLRSNGLKGNVSSIITVENQTLMAVGNATLSMINATYPLLSGINSEAYFINQSGQLLSLGLFGSTQLYVENFSSTPTHNKTAAIIYAASHMPPQLGYIFNYTSFLNSFSENFTGNITSATIKSFNASQITVISPAQKLLIQHEAETLLNTFTYQDYNLADLAPFNLSFYKVASSFAYHTINESLNSSVTGFITGTLNVSLKTFIYSAINTSQPATTDQIAGLADQYSSSGVMHVFSGNPLIYVRPQYIGSFAVTLNITPNISSAVGSLYDGGSFSVFPAVPQPFVFHQFVGYDNSTVITLVNTDVNLTVSQVDAVNNIFRSNLPNVPNADSYAAGSSALSNQLADESLGGMERALIIGIVLSVIIVGVFFRSPVAAFLPLAMFGVSAGTALALNALLYKYVIHGTISFITPTLLLILLLGLSSDYVVYIMARFRREMRGNNPSAIHDSARWAGHAVFTSGITVGLSYVVLWLSGVPIFSDSGLTNAIGVVVAILVANTLLLAILSRGKERVFWPSKIRKGDSKVEQSYMGNIANIVLNHKGKLLIIFVIATLVSSYVYYITGTNMDVFDLVPSSSGIQAIEVVNSSFHGDFFDRGYIILEFPSPVYHNGTFNAQEVSAINAVENMLSSQADVSQVYGPTYPYGYYVPYNYSGSYNSTYLSQMLSYVGSNPHYVMITFQLSSLAWLAPASSFVNSLPSKLSSVDSGHFNYYVGGLTEGLNDAYSFTLSSFIKMIPILCGAIFAVLFIQLSSLFTPLRLLAMVLASVVISLALSYMALHYYAGLPVLIFLPMFTVITLLAVGLDYDIFMVTRVREEAFRGKDDAQGIRTSLLENGGVIITLGTLLFATFGALAFSDIGIIEEIGVGLALGVLIDTFISWPFFVPTVMLFLKRLNWWPSKLSKR